MDYSTKGVTLIAAFVQDILKEVKKVSPESIPKLMVFAEGYDIERPFQHVPIDIYNNMCTWVEENLGQNSLIQIGFNVGQTVFTSLNENKLIDIDSKPIEIIEGLEIVASSLIIDTKERGWEILKHDTSSILMRRTQTFNSVLQLGLLQGLVERSQHANDVKVSYQKEVTKGDEFDEYLIEWGN